ncbi:hypothetical protein AB6D08_09735 [Vibrio splendidus]|uniref:hypothetical protein n=1 Tax=Vibrio TaxID=662 RepID=UPI00233EC3AC|nr:hypothetical protein [Vibrio europaeus]MDC5703755.1 hypothetical protein [Vibrio europaeus]MDC5708291.1 hypothetical protein [Vibrio europaeus]MDC5714302.1 hypothetical protein [Vibrio europaeus]
MGTMIDEFFKKADDSEVIFECVSTPTDIEMMLRTFRYHIKGDDETTATDSEIQQYKDIVMKASNPMALLRELEYQYYVDAILALKKLSCVTVVSKSNVVD